MRIDGRDFDSRYPYSVRPALRRDPQPPFDVSCVVAWFVALPLAWVIVALAIVRVVKLIIDLHSPLH